MDSGELIDLFYNRAYEKFVNKQILDDKNYIVPRQQLKNYVNELVNIPYNDFINYIKQNGIEGEIKASDITRFTSFSACEIEMCNALIWANNPGCQYIAIGRFFPDDNIERSDGAYRRYGECHIKAATQLGLTFEYYGYWYLSCIGYIYPDLDKEVRKRLLARTIIRNRLYQQLLIDILDHDVNPKGYIIRHSGYHFKRCLTSTYFFLDICLSNCRKEGIVIHHLIRRHETHQEITQDDEPLKTNERIENYLLEIRRQKYISVDEEIELAQKTRKGEIDARNKLVSANMRFVVGLAKQYLYKGLEFEDLLHEGFGGLIKAADHFDETRGFKFISYASWWIKRYLTNAIVEDSSLIKYPLNLRILHRRIWDFKIRYEQQNGFMPSITEIGIEDEDNLERISSLDSLPINLKNVCIPCEDLDSFADNHNDIWDYENNEENTHYVRSLLTHLSKRERDVLIRVFGIGIREETLEAIGGTFGLTRERVRQIKEKAIRKLREIVHVSNGKEQEDPVDEESKEIELTIGETERRKRVHKILQRAGRNRRNSSDYAQKEQFRFVNKDKTFEIRGVNNNLLLNSKGYIKSINGNLYCLRIHFSYFNIYTIKETGDGFKVGDLIILALKSSHLYQVIGSKYDKIKDIIQDYSYKEYKVLVDCKWYDNSGHLIIEGGDNLPEESELSLREEDKHNNVSVLDVLNELDGIKVGSRILYNEKECTIQKILSRGSSSRFLVEYSSGILDYVPNDKSKYRIVHTPLMPLHEGPKERKNESEPKHQIGKEASVGDRIIYNSKPCVVLEKSKKDNVIRLKVRYDDGRIDNVLGELNRYEILYQHGNDDNKEPSQLVRQERIVKEVTIPKLKEEFTLLRKSREDLYSHYTQMIMRINQAIVHGKKILAKPALLVAVIDNISSGKIQRNRIPITESLEEKYKYTGKSLFERLTSIAMPFWHLQSDKFWFLEPPYPNAKNFSPSKKWLIDNIKYARLDDDLWYLLQDEAWRNKLRNFIVEQKLIDNSVHSNNNNLVKKTDNLQRSDKNTQPKFLLSTSLSDLVRFGIITKRQLEQCHKKGLRTIGDVKMKIEYYGLTPTSTRFTQYTLNMWFGIVRLLNH